MTTAATRRRGTAHRRIERAQRILEAARELVLRWGYDKTTIDDVARGAGVAKGTIYLHWSSREDLFAALLRWDRAEMVDAVRRALHADPVSATLPGLFSHLAREIHRRPLLRAVLAQDSEVLGKLLQRKQDGGTTPETIGRSGPTWPRSASTSSRATTVGRGPPDRPLRDPVRIAGLRADPAPEPALSDDREGELLGDTVAASSRPGGRRRTRRRSGRHRYPRIRRSGPRDRAGQAPGVARRRSLLTKGNP